MTPAELREQLDRLELEREETIERVFALQSRLRQIKRLRGDLKAALAAAPNEAEATK